MTNRQKLAQETRRKLLDAAFSLLAQKGFDAINVSEITEAANVSKGTFYTYFNRKEDIVLEISRAPFREAAEKIEKMDQASIKEKLEFYFASFVGNLCRFGLNIARQWARDVLDPKNVPDTMDADKWQYDLDTLESILIEGIKRGELSGNAPAKALAKVFLTQLYGMMTIWCMSDGKFDPVIEARQMSKLLIGSVLKPYKGVHYETPQAGKD